MAVPMTLGINRRIGDVINNVGKCHGMYEAPLCQCSNQ